MTDARANKRLDDAARLRSMHFMQPDHEIYDGMENRMIEQKEGDYVIRSGGKDYIRVTCTKDGFTFKISDGTADLGADEVRELVDWITRRLHESAP